jgi:aspartyl-tRNA(Asn)/glutamyl-tRNA(Gln) amidotransferase subunit A
VTDTAHSRVQHALSQIKRWNPSINAMLNVTSTDALACAQHIDALTSQGEWPGLLGGVTVSLKDNIDWVGTPTTAASIILKDNRPLHNAFIVDRLLKAGAVLTGKANLHEWVFGPTSQSLHFGPVKNPWNLKCFAGGSSGGSGASVAAGMSVVSIGSDTGGSIRIPAAFNGLAGLRPTIGRISRSGSVAVSARFDSLGPLARRVSDVARTFEVIAGHDPSDAYSIDCPVPAVTRRLNDPVKGMRIGVMKRWFFDDIHPDLKLSLEKAIGIYRELGVDIVDIDLGDVENAQQMLGFRIILADAYALHEKQLALRRQDYGQDLLIRYDIGKNVTGAQYAEALRWIENFQLRLEPVWRSVDAMLHPTVPFPAPEIAGMDYSNAIRAIPKFTSVFAAAGAPALALPCGFTESGMPLSMEIAAAPFAEEKVLRLGHAFQQVTNHHLREPVFPA